MIKFKIVCKELKRKPISRNDIKNNIGYKLPPCGTPDVTFNLDDK
jgi:hypothetical protein